jgi:hypothetical protein
MQTILPIHIAAGTLSVLAGAAALLFRKGEGAHRTAGTVFVVSMMIMAATAAVLGRDFGNAVAGGLTIYMVTTGWVTARRGDNRAGVFEIGAFVMAFACAVAMCVSASLIVFGAREAPNPLVGPMSFFLGGALALAALGDLSVVLRRGVSGAQRIARHLWRMCFGLFIAVGSFAAQGAEALPAGVPRLELLLSSMIVVLLVMFFWLVRVRFTRWGARAPQQS